MEKHFDLIRTTRNNVLKVINDLSLDQLNHIPSGFNNNIAWNVAHLPVTMELLCYGLSGLPMHLSNEQISAYRKGTSPTSPLPQKDFNFFREQLTSGVDQLEQDYQNGIFKTYKTYPTSYDITLNTIEEAITFNYVHEAVHLGYIMAMKRLIL